MKPTLPNLRTLSSLALATASLVLFSAPTLLAQTAPDAAAAASKPLDQSFPEKVGTYARAAVKKMSPAGEASDSAEAKYTAGSGEIVWTATAFATSEKAQAMLDSTIENFKKEGAKVDGGIKNAEGKVRYAALGTKTGPTYCWVNKKQKNLMYTVTGKAPDVSKFMELQTTW